MEQIAGPAVRVLVDVFERNFVRPEAEAKAGAYLALLRFRRTMTPEDGESWADAKRRYQEAKLKRDTAEELLVARITGDGK